VGPVLHPTTSKNDVSRLPAAADDSQLAIHGSLEFAGIVLAADPISVCTSHFKGVPSLDDVRSLGHSAVLGAEAGRGLASDQSTSAVPRSPARFRGKSSYFGISGFIVLSKRAELM
jgi:hypothetical protein